MPKISIPHLIAVFATVVFAFIIYTALPLLTVFDEIDEQIDMAKTSGTLSDIGGVIEKKYFVEQVGRQTNDYCIITIEGSPYPINISKDKQFMSAVTFLYESSISAPSLFVKGTKIYCDSDGEERQCFYGHEIIGNKLIERNKF